MSTTNMSPVTNVQEAIAFLTPCGSKEVAAQLAARGDVILQAESERTNRIDAKATTLMAGSGAALALAVPCAQGRLLIVCSVAFLAASTIVALRSQLARQIDSWSVDAWLMPTAGLDDQCTRDLQTVIAQVRLLQARRTANNTKARQLRHAQILLIVGLALLAVTVIWGGGALLNEIKWAIGV